MGIKCFMIVDTGDNQLYLRRYKPSTTDGTCHCDEMSKIQRVSGSATEAGYAMPDKTDHRWPVTCTKCGRPFADSDEWRLFEVSIYRREDSGGEILFHSNPEVGNIPVGAMWDAHWIPFWKGPDGKCLTVMTPGGEWMIDSRASNCTLPNDDRHKCWVRHGVPPNITVDKNGLTCSAGAGSIQCGKYHGFLRNGELTTN